MKNSNFRLANTIVISGVSVVISYLINFLLTPYITDSLGIEAYGFVSIAKTAVSYAGIITISLTSFIVRFISVSYHENKLVNARQYYSSTIFASLVLSGTIFIISLIAIWKLEYILDIPSELIESVKILFIIIFLNFVITTVTTPFSASSYIKNRLDISGIFKIVAYICDAVVLYILFSCFKPNIWFVGIGSISASFVILLSSYITTRLLTPDLRFKKGEVSFSKVKDIMKNGIWNSFNSLGNTLNSGLDLLISNLMLSGTETGQIAVAKTINTMFATLYQVVFQPFQPRMLKAYAGGQIDKFIKELKKAMRLCGYFSNTAFAVFFSLGMLYFKLWLPEQDTVSLYCITILTVLGSITAGIMQPVYYINTLTLKNKLPCWITIISGLINVVSMYCLLKYTSLGAYAVVGTTTVIMICINIFFNVIYSSRCLKICPIILYKTLVRHIISCGLMVVVFSALVRLFDPSSWFGLIICAIPMCIIGAIIHMLVTSEKDELRSLLLKFKNKFS